MTHLSCIGINDAGTGSYTTISPSADIMQSFIQFVSAKVTARTILHRYLLRARWLPTSFHSQLDIAPSTATFNPGILSQETCPDIASDMSAPSASELDYTPSMLLYTWSVHSAPSVSRPPQVNDIVLLVLQMTGHTRIAYATICGFTSGFTKHYVVAKAKVDTPFYHCVFAPSPPNPFCLSADGFYTEDDIPRFARGVVPILMPTTPSCLPPAGATCAGSCLAWSHGSCSTPPFAIAHLSASSHLPTIVQPGLIRGMDVSLPEQHPVQFTVPLPDYVLQTPELHSEALTCLTPAPAFPGIGVLGMRDFPFEYHVFTYHIESEA